MTNVVEPREAVTRALAQLGRGIKQSVIRPMYESDIQAYLYHQLVLTGLDVSQIWVETQVCRVNTVSSRRRFDLVIGPLSEAQTCVEPEVVLQLKYFSWTFSEPQCRRRMKGILGSDFPSLGSVRENWDVPCFEILVDMKHVAQGLRGFLDHIWYGTPGWQVVKKAGEDVGAGVVWISPKHASDDALELLVGSL
ncbi:MAG: hypothetical protein ACE5FI_14785 [Anaerolineales bacterium]